MTAGQDRTRQLAQRRVVDQPGDQLSDRIAQQLRGGGVDRSPPTRSVTARSTTA